jgi:predicted CXXCH cytochrome family protein
MTVLKRVFLVISVIFLTLLYNPLSSIRAENMKESDCRNCHGEIYKKALNSPYQHSVALEGCTICHKEGQEQEYLSDNPLEFTVNTPAALNSFILHIRHVKKDKKYKMKVVLSDEYDERTEPVEKEIDINTLPDYTNKINPLKAISDVKIQGVKKGPYVKAIVTWHTDAPSTTAIEYMIKDSKQRPYFISYRDLYSWDHKIELYRLKHRSIYSFRVKSKGLFGKTLVSREATIDTSKEIPIPESSKRPFSVIKDVTAFRLKDHEGVFLLVEANKPVYCNVKIEETKNEKIKTAHKFKINRYAAIYACEGCHSFNVSHPVGIRAQGEHVRTPTDLPTIDNGIITCASCHDPHGSHNLFLARIDFKADLCLKCHDNTIYRR